MVWRLTSRPFFISQISQSIQSTQSIQSIQSIQSTQSIQSIQSIQTPQPPQIIYYFSTPSSRPTFMKALMQRSSCSLLCPAEICTLILA